jgi:hypothetical protein
VEKIDSLIGLFEKKPVVQCKKMGGGKIKAGTLFFLS